MAAAERDAAFTAYATARLPWLRRVAFLMCRDWHRADDLVQVTVTKLYANWQRAAQVENLDAYARKILVNTFLAEQRSPWWKRMVTHEGAASAAEAAGAGSSMRGGAGEPDIDAVLDLRSALRTLPPKQRATLVLRYYEELSVEQTAQMLGCSTGTVKSQTFRALASLRRVLGIEDTDQDETEEGVAGEAAATYTRLDGPAEQILIIDSLRMGGANS